MSYTYLSADWHLSHENIIKYSNRPFQDYIHMNETLIKNANERMNEDDIFIHVGDWCFTNKNIKQKASDYEKCIKAKLIHVNGNHDRNNSVKNCIEEITLKTAKLNILVRHIPIEDPEDFYKMKDFDFVICGHVHEKWRHKIVYSNNFGEDSDYRIMINVGCDVWKYKPVRLNEVVEYYYKIQRDIIEEKLKLKSKR